MGDHVETSSRGLMFSNSMYDTIRRIVEFILPGLGALYFSLAQIWNLAYGAEIVGSLSVLAVFGGVLLSASRKKYDQSDDKYAGELVPVDVEGETGYRLQLNTNDADALLGKKDIVFKGGQHPDVSSH